MIVVVPVVVPFALAALFVTTKLHWPVEACVKLPVCDLAMDSTGAGSIPAVRVLELVAVMPPPLAETLLVTLTGALFATLTGITNCG